MFSDKRIKIIIGHYGSGKTEFAVNYVMRLAKEKSDVAIVDLDIVNPYFRSREKHPLMEKEGILVISSGLGHKANLDIPSVSSMVITPLQDKKYDVVLDVGGNSVGAKILNRYRLQIENQDYDMFCVVNGNRPDTSTVEGAIEHIRDIEASSGLKVTGLINNTHFLRETSVEDVLKGQEIVEEVSRETGIPIKYISCIEEICDDMPAKYQDKLFPIKMYMREAWM